MADKVEIEIVAKDEASKVIAGVSDELSSISSITKGEALRELGSAGAEAFQAITAAAGEYIDLAAEAEVITARMEAQIRALGTAAPVTAQQMQDLAGDLSKLSGFDDEDLLAAQTTLLNFGLDSEEAFNRASKAATNLAALTGQDVKSAFQQVGIALDTGNWGRLTRTIGDLTDAEKTALKAARDLGDEHKAQQIILDALERKTNGAAEAIGNTWTGKLAKARVETDNLKQSVGDFILNGLNQLPQPALTAGMAIGDLGSSLLSIAGPLANVAIIATSLKAGAFAGLTGALVGLKTAFLAAAAAIAAPFIAAIAAVGTTVLAIVALGAAIAVLIEAVIVLGPTAWKAFTQLMQIGAILSARLIRSMEDIVRRGFEWLARGVESMGQKIYGVFERIKTWASGLWTSLSASFQRLISGAQQWGKDIVDGLWQGIQSGWDWLTEQVQGLVDKLLGDTQANLESGSPSRKWAREVGLPMAQGVEVGFNSGMGGVSSSIGQALSPRAFSLSPASVGGGGGRGVTVQISPSVMLADEAYVQGKLRPYVREALRGL